ncbi:MAG: hypothetical protein ACRELD_02360 [Longimicrobiales bacterium]
MRRATSLLALALCVACGDAPAARPGEVAARASVLAQGTPYADTCRVRRAVALPPALHETSGLARGLRNPDVLWTHNDAGNPAVLHGVAESGRIVARARLDGARNVDWEDIASARCADGTCVFIADIGDNEERRSHVTVYVLAEPGIGDSRVSPTATLNARFPDGPQDAEALFVSSDGGIYLVTKGRQGVVGLYRFPALDSSQIHTLKWIRQLAPRPRDDRDRVTAAAAAGAWIALRTYRTLYLFEASSLLAGSDAVPQVIDLSPLGERAGEGLEIAADGRVWLSSEAARGDAPRLLALSCPLP